MTRKATIVVFSLVLILSLSINCALTPAPIIPEGPRLIPTFEYNLVGTQSEGWWAIFQYFRNTGQEGEIVIQVHLETLMQSTDPIEQKFPVEKDKEYKLTVVLACYNVSALGGEQVTVVIDSPSGLHVERRVSNLSGTVKIRSVELKEL